MTIFASLELGFRWCFAVSHPLPRGCLLRLSRLGCVMCFFYVLRLFSSPLGAPKVPLRTPANDHFLPRLSSDLDGVLLFRIHCQKAAVLRLSRLGCVTFFVYVLGFFSSPFLGAPKVPFCLGTGLFSSPLGAPKVPLRTPVYVLGLFSSRLGAPKVPLRTPANDHFLHRLSSDLGGVLLVSHPLPRGCRFAFV